jgi:hypothetical protein
MSHRSCLASAITALPFLDAASKQLPVTNRKKCGDYYTEVKKKDSVGTDRRVRPQLLKHKTSPAVLITTGLVYQNEKPLD